MLVHYNRPNVAHFMLPTTGDFIATGDAGVKFLPGINEVPTKTWEALMKHTKAPKLIEDRVLVVKSKVDATDEKSAISQLKPEEAKGIIEVTYNKLLLTTWVEAETRPKVLAMLKAQLKSIDAQTTRKKETDEDGDEG